MIWKNLREFSSFKKLIVTLVERIEIIFLSYLTLIKKETGKFLYILFAELGLMKNSGVHK